MGGWEGERRHSRGASKYAANPLVAPQEVSRADVSLGFVSGNKTDGTGLPLPVARDSGGADQMPCLPRPDQPR